MNLILFVVVIAGSALMQSSYSTTSHSWGTQRRDYRYKITDVCISHLERNPLEYDWELNEVISSHLHLCWKLCVFKHLHYPPVSDPGWYYYPAWALCGCYLHIPEGRKDPCACHRNLRMTPLAYGLGVCKRSCSLVSDALRGKPGIWIQSSRSGKTHLKGLVARQNYLV